MVAKIKPITGQGNNELKLAMYKDLMESFFKKNYPNLDPEEFWNWFLKTITQKDLNINTLSDAELNGFLSEITELGNQFFTSIKSTPK